MSSDSDSIYYPDGEIDGEYIGEYLHYITDNFA